MSKQPIKSNLNPLLPLKKVGLGELASILQSFFPQLVSNSSRVSLHLNHGYFFTPHITINKFPPQSPSTSTILNSRPIIHHVSTREEAMHFQRKVHATLILCANNEHNEKNLSSQKINPNASIIWVKTICCNKIMQLR